MKAIIFDLDGTLLDTLQDLCISVNHALQVCGMPGRSLAEVRRFVGNGVRLLVARAVPEGCAPEAEEECFRQFRLHYVEHCLDHTALYPGIEPLLSRLHRLGVPMAVVSNKLQAGVDELAARFFSDTIQVAIGEREGVARKPAPDMVRLAISQLDASEADGFVYVGDSDVDLQTARNAGLPCISVLWGFRDRAFLEAHGATVFAEKPEDILNLINQQL